MHSDDKNEDVDEDGASVVWNSIHDRMFPLCQRILSCRAVSVAGFGVQARTISLVSSDIWECEVELGQRRLPMNWGQNRGQPEAVSEIKDDSMR
jgi:hypothetical protein